MEAETAAELNISRTPVREAFRKLEQEGLVSYEPGRGVVVTYLGSQDMLEIYAIMVALEGMAARLAAANVTAAEIEVMEKLLSEMENARSRNSYLEFERIHEEFNQAIFRGAQNRHLFELLKRYQDYISRTGSVSWQRKGEELEYDHRALLAAIKDGDGNKAEQIMRTHVEHSRQVYINGMGDK